MQQILPKQKKQTGWEGGSLPASLDISDPLAFTKAHCETELNSAEHAIDLLKSLAINAER